MRHTAGFRFARRAQAFKKDLHERGRAVTSGRSEGSGGGERAEDGVDGELFDGRLQSCGVCLLARLVTGLGKVGGGDLERVEEEAGAARVDVVGGDAAEDFADGELDGGAVFGHGEIEGGATGAAMFGPGDGLAGGVMEVAEGLGAEAGRAAAAAVGVDVAAALAFGDGFGHRVLPLGKLCKIFG